MKAIAIIKVPEGDGKWYLDGVIRYTENKSTMKRFDKEMFPLKPLPKEFGIDVDDDYAKGWNDCLKEITE